MVVALYLPSITADHFDSGSGSDSSEDEDEDAITM